MQTKFILDSIVDNCMHDTVSWFGHWFEVYVERFLGYT